MSNYTDKERVELAEKEYEIESVNQPINIGSKEQQKYIGKVASIQDGTDSGSGEQV
ncbi:hypothetical protein [Streptococcus chenjunshii]|uniref:hypothetical protein n=1 Tax=Streptococcus chenjunshii TaxID=2173853 RepID=UPI0013C354C6|nr:hypothetical protein [Streptococcus chenjunshii]